MAASSQDGASATSPRRGSGATDANSPSTGIIGRARRASLTVMNINPQLGMWQAAGTAIAQAPNLTELRDMESGGDNIAFNSQGHSARLAAVHEDTGRLALVRTNTTFRVDKASEADVKRKGQANMDESIIEAAPSSSEKQDDKQDGEKHHHHHLFGSHHHGPREKAKWGPTILHGLNAFWKFFTTPAGFLITIYGLNIVAWGAMLFFLLLKAAPAMNHPSADDNSSPRKIWLEIDSQILNALFCVTGFGLAPWRFRDLYWFIRAVHFHDKVAMRKLSEQNRSWFRPPAWATEDDGDLEAATSGDAGTGAAAAERSPASTFTGKRAPVTPFWKLGFTIWMMVLNTLVQAVLCYFMWHYNRIERPSWATGTFIGLGCGVAMLAGLMSWWEGRKVKKIEGPEVKIVE